MVAGLEMMRYKPCIQRQKMFYWEQKGEECCRDRLSGNPQHEDYPYRNQIGHTGRHEESLAIHEREKAHRSLPLFLREFWSI